MKVSKILIKRERIAERVKHLAAAINTDYKGRELVVIGILNGSFVFLADLIRELEVDIKVEFMGVSSYQDGTESSGKLLITKDLQLNLNLADVLIVEDIIDTGVTAARLVEMLKSRNPRSIKVCALLNKQSRRMNDVKADYIAFEIEDEFVVGYGLDCAGKFRQLPYIGVVGND